MAIKSCVLCSFIILGIIHASIAASFRYYLPQNQSLDNYIVAPLEQPLELVSVLKDKVNITLYTFGLDGKVDGPATTAMLTAYMNSSANTNDKALCLIDWEIEATTVVTDIEYVLVRERAKKVGVQLGKALYILVQNGVLNVFRLVAHSLGTLVMAVAAREFKKYSNDTLMIPSITGLDPAGPLNNYSGLKSTDAVIVIGLHTNPGQFGTTLSVGIVDFWANCDSNNTQPGCPTDPLELLFSKDARMCSHNRSWMIYSQALLSPYAFIAACVSSCSVWRSQSSTTTQTNYLGENTNPNIQGNCFFSTTSSSPFSKGQGGLTPN